MSGPDESGPVVAPADTAVPVEEAQRVALEIRAVAESRGDDSDVFELVELAASGRARRESAGLPPTGRTRRESIPPLISAVPEPSAKPEELTPDELRDAWPLLDVGERVDGLRVLDREDAEEFFIALPAHDQAQLLIHFRAGQRRQWMRLLEPDDVADVIQDAGEEHRQTLLALLDAPTRKEVLALLAYAEDEAGGLMSTRFARLRPNMTADEALLYLRRQARAKLETIYVAYVLDMDQCLMGVVSFRDLFAADPKRLVSDIMETDVVRVTEDMDQETVSRLFAEHDLNVIPVVDHDGKMIGIVTVDDIVDVVQEEATEDIQKFGGMEALDMPYLQARRRDMLVKRGRWLVLLLVGEMLTTTAMGFFEDQLRTALVLTLFIPLIVSAGGNSGSQASTLVIRAMALGELRGRDWWLVMRRELMMGLALGAVLGGIATLRVFLWGTFGTYGEHFLLVGAVVGLAVLGCVLSGTLAGSMLPFILRKMGADPASASAPFVATLVDVTGIVIYFTVANIILSGVLL
jgi:magnesium transporter